MILSAIKKASPKWLLNKVFRPIARHHITQRILRYFNNRPWLSDEQYIRKLYNIRFETKLNLEHPLLFNEKNNWRKLYDHKPIYTDMVDKYRIKSVIKERIGAEHAFELLDVWKDPNEINLSALPDKFVLKTNHAGGVIICRDKNNFDLKKAQKELARTLKINYFLASREWPYKNVVKDLLTTKCIPSMVSRNIFLYGKIFQKKMVANPSLYSWAPMILTGRKPILKSDTPLRMKSWRDQNVWMRYLLVPKAWLWILSLLGWTATL